MPARREPSGGQQDSGAAESRPPSRPVRSSSARPTNDPTKDLANDPANDPVQVLLDALLSGSDDSLLEAMRSYGPRLLPEARHGLLAASLAALPVEVRRSDPTILVLESMFCRITLRYDDAIRLSSAAQAVVDERGAGAAGPYTHDWILLMLLWRSRCGWADPHEAVARARSRLGCRHSASNGHTLGPGGSVEWSSWLMGELATVQILTGDLEEAALHLDEMVGNARVLGHDRMLAEGLAHRALLELVDGAYQTAAATARSSLLHAARGGAENVPHIACAHLVLGWAAVQEADFSTGREHLLAAVAEPSLRVDHLLPKLARLLEIKLLAKEGSLPDARRLLAEHRHEPASDPAFLQRLELVTSAQVASMASDYPAIRDHVITLTKLGYLDDAELFEATVEGGAGRIDAALDRLDALLAQPRLHQAVGAAAAALQVGLLVRAGRASRAAALLPDLLNRVAPQRMLLILSVGYLGGRAFTRLLEAEALRPGGHPFAADALASLDQYARPFPDLDTRVDADVSFRLTPRERDVLAELSLGGSYADVAAALFVSENTVKTHLGSAYRKLGVDRRVDALRVARDNHVL